MRALGNGYRRAALAALSAAAVGLAPAGIGAPGAPVAMAHDSVLTSTPRDGENLDEFPREIEILFSGIPKPQFNTVAVSNAGTGEILFTAEPDLSDQHVLLEVPDNIQPGDGEYIIGFQITSSDGHSTRGKLTFSVGDYQITAGGGSDLEEDGVPVFVWAIGGGLVALIIAVVAGVAVVNRKAD